MVRGRVERVMVGLGLEVGREAVVIVFHFQKFLSMEFALCAPNFDAS